MDKVYQPITIPEVTLPGAVVVTQNVATSIDASTNDSAQPTTTPDTNLPIKKVAQEVIGETLNTKAKKILGDYSFTQQGSIEIGQYQPGASGDIRITPNGITARNIAGERTFNLDGDTGDAEFAGKIRAGAFIGGNGGSIVIEETNAGNGRIVLFRGGVPSIIIGDIS